MRIIYLTRVLDLLSHWKIKKRKYKNKKLKAAKTENESYENGLTIVARKMQYNVKSLISHKVTTVSS